MNIEKTIPLLDEILNAYRDYMGANYDGYRNHCYRMLHFCMQLHPPTDDEREKLIIAAAFHDMGLWTENTVDYLPPSMVLAREWLKTRGKEAWADEIAVMIDMHHKFTPYRGEFPLVEIFRRADLADFSLGMVKGGVPGAFVKKVRAAFPNAGFHKTLMKIAFKWTS